MSDGYEMETTPEALATAIRYVETEARVGGYELTARLLGAAVQAALTEQGMKPERRNAIVHHLSDYRRDS